MAKPMQLIYLTHRLSQVLFLENAFVNKDHHRVDTGSYKYITIQISISTVLALFVYYYGIYFYIFGFHFKTLSSSYVLINLNLI